MDTTTTAPPRVTLWRTKLVRETPPEEKREALTSFGKVRGPAGVARLFAALYADEPAELFVAFLLDTQHRVRGLHVVSRGVVDASVIHPREVFRSAILANASAVIVVHNHPSGDPTPSPEDRAVTRKLRDAGETVGIRLLDSLVVGDMHGMIRWQSIEDNRT